MLNYLSEKNTEFNKKHSYSKFGFILLYLKNILLLILIGSIVLLIVLFFMQILYYFTQLCSIITKALSYYTGIDLLFFEVSVFILILFSIISISMSLNIRRDNRNDDWRD